MAKVKTDIGGPTFAKLQNGILKPSRPGELLDQVLGDGYRAVLDLVGADNLGAEPGVAKQRLSVAGPGVGHCTAVMQVHVQDPGFAG